jgi:sugar lactone lactonase YvrE
MRRIRRVGGGTVSDARCDHGIVSFQERFGDLLGSLEAGDAPGAARLDDGTMIANTVGGAAGEVSGAERFAVACTTEQTVLGEGARWDARRGELLRVDILRGRVFRDVVAPDGGLRSAQTYQLPVPVGAIAPVWNDDGWLLAAGGGFVHLASDGATRDLADVVAAGARMNDAACDARGRCWAGSLADDHRPGGGALHRLDTDGRVETVLDGLTIPNGIGWDPDGETMYLVDSGPGEVFAFSFDPDRGAITAGRVLITVSRHDGTPDGLTVDAAGDLWVAMYGGGRVHRYAPDGMLREVVAVPALQTTCCAFGGVGLRRLYVTTATEGWTDEQRSADPAAGLVYRVDTGATGLPAAPFVPDPTWWGTARGHQGGDGR